MKKNLLLVVALFLGGCLFGQAFRPPAVPLVTHDPYFSIWSPSNNLYDRDPVHWTGRKHPMYSLIRIDGKTFRIMGEQPSGLEPLRQVDLHVYPTRSVYVFRNDVVELSLSFISPVLVSDLDLFSRPLTYLNWEVKPLDGKEHDVQLLYACGGDVAVNDASQQVNWDFPAIKGIKAARIFSIEQPVLKKSGDDLRIDWGYAYVSSPEDQRPRLSVGERTSLFEGFIQNGKTDDVQVLSHPRKVSDGNVTIMLSWNLGKVNGKVSRLAMLSYDDILSIQYFDAQLPAWWRRNGMTMEKLIPKAAKEFSSINQQCVRFDSELMSDLEKAGGPKYSAMCALVYRQCVAGNKLVADAKGMPLLFLKENFSNGCIATVDVIYPAAPFFFLFSKALTKAMLQPNLDYAASKRWRLPFAPHDLGTYPHATGQVYGAGEDGEDDQMPVEETGNMIIMVTALAQMEGNAKYAEAHWPVIEKWCEYLLSKGFDPENQLCTDDFAGHLAHNINLSAKAIVAIGCYARLCEMTGRKDKAADVRKKAEAMAKDWVKLATEGDHTLLAYDRPGTWSQKYNMVWDRLLGLNLFPSEVYQKEISFYKTKLAPYGLPLDSRKEYTKSDWITWSATMADNQSDFRTIFDPVYDFANATPQRVPLSDWYMTNNANQVGFQARCVVGGFLIKMLSDQQLWKKWLDKGTDVNGKWAPLKIIPFEGKVILPASLETPVNWQYTTEKPSDNWFAITYDDKSWKTGLAGFGSPEVKTSRTSWKTSDIWIRREFELKEVSGKKLALLINHDEDADVYINGVFVISLDGFISKYLPVKTEKVVNKLLKAGKNTIAIHCHQTLGGQYIDCGLLEY